jgi:hypothetical protein
LQPAITDKLIIGSFITVLLVKLILTPPPFTGLNLKLMCLMSLSGPSVRARCAFVKKTVMSDLMALQDLNERLYRLARVLEQCLGSQEKCSQKQ